MAAVALSLAGLCLPHGAAYLVTNWSLPQPFFDVDKRLVPRPCARTALHYAATSTAQRRLRGASGSGASAAAQCWLHAGNTDASVAGRHFAHDAQSLLTCWSFFRTHPRLRPVLVVDRPGRVGAGPGVQAVSRWTQGLVELMRVEVASVAAPVPAPAGQPTETPAGTDDGTARASGAATSSAPGRGRQAAATAAQPRTGGGRGPPRPRALAVASAALEGPQSAPSHLATSHSRPPRGRHAAPSRRQARPWAHLPKAADKAARAEAHTSGSWEQPGARARPAGPAQAPARGSGAESLAPAQAPRRPVRRAGSAAPGSAAAQECGARRSIGAAARAEGALPALRLDAQNRTAPVPWAARGAARSSQRRRRLAQRGACELAAQPRAPPTAGWQGDEVRWLADAAHAHSLHRRMTHALHRRGADVDRGAPGGRGADDAAPAASAASPSALGRAPPPALRVGILQRRGTRQLAGESSLVAALRAVLPEPDATVEVGRFEGLSFEAQAAFVLSRDLILTPHGAQNANLLFARPCAAVVELFPRHYFLPGFYLPLAQAAGALTFAGFPAPSLADATAQIHNATAADRRRARAPALQPPVTALFGALPGVLRARVACLEGKGRRLEAERLRAVAKRVAHAIGGALDTMMPSSSSSSSDDARHHQMPVLL